MLAELERINKRINGLELELYSLPPGKLYIIKDKAKTSDKWYLSTEKGMTYIRKTEIQLAEALAKKRYLKAQLDYLIQERLAITFYLSHHPNDSKNADTLLSSRYSSLLTPYFKTDSQLLQDWVNEPYLPNQAHPEHLIHQSSSGHLVRSKSEAFIDSMLFKNKIPFKYECPLVLNDILIYPDFTIKHPRTHMTYYWEHFGLIDMPTYMSLAQSKLNLFISNDIIPSINLITTYETKEHPLSFDLVEKIITNYFLS